MTAAVPRRRVRAFLIVAAAAFVVAAVVAGTLLNDSGPTPRRGPAALSAPFSPTPVPTADPGQVSSPAPFAPVPPSVGKRTTTEVEAGGSVSHRLPPSKPAAALYIGPVPKSASAAGRLVRAFPSTIPVAPGSKVTSSSISSSGQVFQASLVARTTLNASAVGTFYSRAFRKLGIAAERIPGAADSSEYAFVRGKDSITISITPASGGSRFSVFGVLHATS